MKYIVLIDEGGGLLSTAHVYAPPGGGWIDFEAARAWAQNHVDIKPWKYQVVVLEPAPG